MKINFAEIKFRPSLFEPEIIDKELAPTDKHPKRRPIAWQIADELWRSTDIVKAKVGERIYENFGKETEISDIEKGYVKEALASFPQWVRVRVLEALGEKAE